MHLRSRTVEVQQPQVVIEDILGTTSSAPDQAVPPAPSTPVLSLGLTTPMSATSQTIQLSAPLASSPLVSSLPPPPLIDTSMEPTQASLPTTVQVSEVLPLPLSALGGAVPTQPMNLTQMIEAQSTFGQATLSQIQQPIPSLSQIMSQTALTPPNVSVSFSTPSTHPPTQAFVAPVPSVTSIHLPQLHPQPQPLQVPPPPIQARSPLSYTFAQPQSIRQGQREFVDPPVVQQSYGQHPFHERRLPFELMSVPHPNVQPVQPQVQQPKKINVSVKPQSLVLASWTSFREKCSLKTIEEYPLITSRGKTSLNLSQEMFKNEVIREKPS